MKSARVALRANTNWAILEATRHRLGFSILPTFLVRDEPDLVEARAPRDTLVYPAKELTALIPELLGARRAGRA